MGDDWFLAWRVPNQRERERERERVGETARVRGVNWLRNRDRLIALVRETRPTYVVVVSVERGWCNSDTRSLTEFPAAEGAGRGHEMEAIRGPQYRRILRICYFPRRPN